MSSRKPVYLISVILLAVVLTLPQILLGLFVSHLAYRMGTGPAFSIPFFVGQGKDWLYRPEYVPFWRDKFIELARRRSLQTSNAEITLASTDPETGAKTELDVTLSNPHHEPIPFGDRLLVQRDSDHWGEWIDGKLEPSEFSPPNLGFVDPEYFVWSGEFACAGMVNGRYSVFTFTGGTWNKVGDIALPRATAEPAILQRDDRLQCITQRDRLHLFLTWNGRIYYREGLVVTASQDGRETAPRGDEDPDRNLASWSLVRSFDRPLTPDYSRHSRANWGILIGGQPAVLCVAGIDERKAVGQIDRFDGTTWKRSGSLPFPFGTVSFRAVASTDGERSYVICTTSTGAMHVYAIEETGFRETGLSEQGLKHELRDLELAGTVPMAMLGLGVILGCSTWLLMRSFTSSEYAFGTQTVKLASLGPRGLARLIDLGLIGITTAGLGWLMSTGFDWKSFIEAAYLNVDHPTVSTAVRVSSVLVLWMLAAIVAILMAQGRWGLTPGKWICRLRTVRTSLQPCGVARSLVRECLFFVDCCNFLCWTPGIVSIALTNRRQRLGDIVADSIVVKTSRGKLANKPEPRNGED